MNELDLEIESLHIQRNMKNEEIEKIFSLFTPSNKDFVLSDKSEKRLATLMAEVKEINEELDGLKAKQAEKMETARIIKVKNLAQGSKIYAGQYLKEKTAADPGILFARYATALGAAKGNLPQAYELSKNNYGEDSEITLNLRAAVAAGTTTNPTWGKPLVETYNSFAGDFVEFLRPRTILGKFGENGIPSLRKVPFGIRVPSQVSGGDGWWVGEAQGKPITRFDFSEITLGFAKVANIAVITDELLRFGRADTELIIRDQLAAALIERMDRDFVDPAKALVTNVSPASITNNAFNINSSGNTIDHIQDDVKRLFADFLKNNPTVKEAVWIMPSSLALSLSILTNVLGQREFPKMTLEGGEFFGIPVIVSDYVKPEMVILVNAKEIFYADDGFVSIDVSNQASLQMTDTPTVNSANLTDVAFGPTPASLVSLWQTNSTGFRAERFVNWQKRRPNAVGYIANVNWGTI